MSITITGLLLLLAAFVFLFFREDLLLPALVFFIPFSCTAVLNVTAVSYGLAPTILFALCYFLLIFVTGRYTRRAILARDAFLSLMGLIGFAFCVLVSAAVASLQGPLTLFQVTQNIFMCFGIFMALVFALALTDEAVLRRAMTAFRWSAVFISLWGVLQVACFYSGIPYPSVIFNNSISDFANMYDQRQGAVIRIASVAVEPSYMAFSLLSFFTFATTMLFVRKEYWRRDWLFAAILSGGVMLLSTSSSAYFGLVVFGLLLIFQRPALLLVAGVGLTLAASAVLAALPKLREALYVMTIGKSSTYSYKERTGSMTEAFRTFGEQPIFGGGWGVDHSYSIATQLLANVGLLGTCAFLVAAALPLMAAHLTRRQLDARGPSVYATPILAASNALFVLLATCIVAGFRYGVLDIWFIWGLLIALVTLGRRELAVKERAMATAEGRLRLAAYPQQQPLGARPTSSRSY